MPTANFARMLGTTALLGAELLPDRGQSTGIEWFRSTKPVPYLRAVNAMEERVAAIAQGRDGECVWLLEHPPLYTAGTSADPAELLQPDRFPVHTAGRGGRYTYHGPGQRVAYVMLNLQARGGDVRAFVRSLQDWIVAALASLGVAAYGSDDGIGVWAGEGDAAGKIASIGIRVRRGITYHGISLNVAPELEHFSGIVPCGLEDRRVTSLKALGRDVSLPEADQALQRAFAATLSAASNYPRR